MRYELNKNLVIEMNFPKIDENMADLLKAMDDAREDKFEMIKEAKQGLIDTFIFEKLGTPTESDYSFFKIIYNKMMYDFGKAFPNWKPVISMWDFNEVLGWYFNKYAEILEKNLTPAFIEKYDLPEEKQHAILLLATSWLMAEMINGNEKEVEGMQLKDKQCRNEARFEEFMKGAKEQLESAFSHFKLEKPTIPDYMLLHMVIEKMASDFIEDHGNRRVIIPKSCAEETIEKIASDYTNLWKESLDPETIKEHSFTDERIASVVWCASFSIFEQYVMEDEEIHTLMVESMNKEIQERDPSPIYA